MTVEGVRQRTGDIALFVVNRPGDRFAAIEKPAAVSGLPILRAGREIDPQLLRSQELGFLNGHVPVTGIISAIAVLAAVLNDRNAVVMSNEWSASVPTLEHNGRQVNHQWSKSAAFEASFRELLKADPAGLPDYFSALRDRTELWVGERFARLTQYHGTFRSCNRAFHIDTRRRLDHWCGQCDKCCFIDLILAPFMPAEQLRAVFAADGGGNASDNPEPLDNPELKPKFQTLLGSGTKPFECVGEVNECRAAVVLAASRQDRGDTTLLRELAAEVTGAPTRRPRRRSRPCGTRWGRASSRPATPSWNHDGPAPRSSAGPTCAVLTAMVRGSASGASARKATRRCGSCARSASRRCSWTIARTKAAYCPPPTGALTR